MNQIFLILLLYIIFGVVGPIIKRMQRLQQTPPKTPASKQSQRTPQQKIETGVEKYFTRLQEAFQQPSEPPSSGQDMQSKLLSIATKSADSEKTELELLPPPLPTKSRTSTPHRPSSVRRKPTLEAPRNESLLSFNNRRGYIQGILMAEILGPPVSKRSKR